MQDIFDVLANETGLEIEADAAMANQTSEAHGSVGGDETNPGRLETNGRNHFQEDKQVVCTTQFIDLALFWLEKK